MDLLRTEYDIQHHLVLSRRNVLHHALIRMIVSTLSTPEELLNLRKKDFRINKGKKMEYYTVKLIEKGKIRISPVDRRTFEIIRSMPPQPFRMGEDEMNEIVGLYSPPGKKYNCRSLRKAVESILSDSDFFGMNLRNDEERYAFMLDFNPLYSGLWDLEDEEEVEDFILSYSEVTGTRDWRKISDEIGIEPEVVRRVIESGKKSILFR
uniref:Uncharacterized protein n=1 Tax=Archaeoglobus fulgidus TaxID=2234 RepID=A0A7C2S3Y0_ARCFL